MRAPMLAVLLALGPDDDGCLAAFGGAAPQDPAHREAVELWLRDCASCHGVTGAADGRLAATLERRPHSLADGCHPIADAWVARVILEGGAGFGGDPAMQAHHALDARPEVLAALVEVVQGFRIGKPCDAEVQPPIVGPDELD